MIIVKLLNEFVIIFNEMAPYILLGLFFAGLLHLFFTKEWVSKHVGKNNITSIVKSVLFGIPLPLCSCGVIPTAVFMSQNGASQAAIVAFLIATPQTGIDSIIATYGMMGLIFALFRPFAALVTGVVGGLVTLLFSKNEKFTIKQSVCTNNCGESDKNNGGLKARIKKLYNYAFVEFLDDISTQFIIGIIISALISYFIPSNYFENSKFSNGTLGMLTMILLGIPLYICATASIPIAVTLISKGLSPGVAFVFLEAGPATNIVSIIILMKILGKKITAIYLGVIMVCTMLMGHLLNFIFSYFDISYQNMILQGHIHANGSGTIKIFFSVIFVFMLILSFKRKIIAKYFSNNKCSCKKSTDDTIKVKIDGMTCNHCRENVTNAIKNIEGVHHVEVNLQGKYALIQGNFDIKKIHEAVTKIGYKIIPD
ncbi:MAG: hypothetical protein ACD_79C00293G0004 [uncultured bacterium]|nr:MAG: hypothetical protein ACD_79C00293G0004 [uncultured bacterium]